MNLILLKKSDYISKDKVEIKGRRYEHIINILKSKSGETLKVGLLNNKLGVGNIKSIGKQSIVIEVKLEEEPPKKSNIEIIMAMPRPKVFRRIIEDLTTMGVKKIYVIKTWKVEKSFWNSMVLEEEKLKETMILGLEQSKDTIVPQIEVYKRFKPFIEDVAPIITKDRKKILADPSGLESIEVEGESELTIAIGPEGGFIPYEIEKFKKVGFRSFSLGKRILRTETVIPYIIGKFS